MATILEVWERLDRLIRERTTGAYDLSLLYHDRMEVSKKGTKVRRGAKYIIGAVDSSAAVIFSNEIRNFLYDEKNYIIDKANQKPKPYKLNVKIVDNVGMTARLKRTTAKSTRIHSYDAVMEYLDDKEKLETGDHEDTAEACRRARQKLINHYIMTGDEYYYVTVFSGASYKVSYHDLESRQTKQVSVGDILILVGANEVQTNLTGRKERANKITESSEDVIAKVWWTFIRVLPDEIKEKLRLEAEKKAKGKA